VPHSKTPEANNNITPKITNARKTPSKAKIKIQKEKNNLKFCQNLFIFS
jgi:hypothetical protein